MLGDSLGRWIWMWGSFTIAILIIAELSEVPVTHGFSPYRSTDAETADPGHLEARLGLFRLDHEGKDNTYLSPLLRLNLGLLRNFELNSDFGYLSDEGQVDEAEIGFKWIPFELQRSLSIGIETVALLPVSSDEDNGTGVDGVLLATWRLHALDLHFNAGGFYDARPVVSESGWKSGFLIDGRFGRVRPGLEIFAAQKSSRPVALELGPGLIVDLGPFDIRVGLHFGLTSEATDFAPSLWGSREFPIW